MATFGWSYKSNVSGTKRPKDLKRKLEDWQRDREDVKIPLHRQTHSAESVKAGLKRRRYHPRAKIFVGNLNKDTKTITLAEYFSFFGEIAYMKMIKDKETGLSRGFAFITFVEVHEAEKAVRWCRGNHPRVDGKEIRVGFAERRIGPAHKHASVASCDDALKERSDSHTLYWEYKWSEDPQSEVYGPYETSMMLQWVNMGYFSSGCWVRQVHHITTNHGTTQELQHEDKNLPTIPSLVDAYSSSSDDEEIDSTPPKKDDTQYMNDDYVESNEIRQNSESKNWQKDAFKEGLNEIFSNKVFEKGRTVNEVNMNLFQDKSTNVQSICENSNNKTNQIIERLSQDKDTDNPIIENNQILMQNVDDNTKQGNIVRDIDPQNNAFAKERTYESNTQSNGLSVCAHINDTFENKKTNKQIELLQHEIVVNKTIIEESIKGSTEAEHYMHKTSPHQIHHENRKCTSKEVTKMYCNDNELEVVGKNQFDNEMDIAPSYYTKDKDGYKTKDMFGRDSSSDDEDYEDYFDQQLSDNEFVHISEINFSMFP